MNFVFITQRINFTFTHFIHIKSTKFTQGDIFNKRSIGNIFYTKQFYKNKIIKDSEKMKE